MSPIQLVTTLVCLALTFLSWQQADMHGTLGALALSLSILISGLFPRVMVVSFLLATASFAAWSNSPSEYARFMKLLALGMVVVTMLVWTLQTPAKKATS